MNNLLREVKALPRKQRALVVLDGQLETRLPKWLENSGSLEFADTSTHPDVIIAINHSNLAIKLSKELRVPRVLVGLEPPCVEPRHSAGYACRRYDHVILTHSRNLMTHPPHNLTYSTFPVPIKHRLDLVEKSRAAHMSERVEQIGVIAANKCSLSKTEQYHLRRQIMMALFNSNITFALYGNHWSRRDNIRQISIATAGYLSRAARTGPEGFATSIRRIGNLAAYSYWRSMPADRYHGRSTDVVETYRRLRFALVVENDSTFTSEKAFDALDAGCLVLYVGDGDSPFPRECVEMIRPKTRDLASSITNFCAHSTETLENLRLTKLEAYSSWLQTSDATRRANGLQFDLENVLATLADPVSRRSPEDT